MHRILSLILALGTLLTTPPGAGVRAQEPECPGRHNLQQVADCLGSDHCDRQIPQENLDAQDCEKTIHAWARDPKNLFAAIRDIKMCQGRRRIHAPQFVHGLAIPIRLPSHEHVCGVEDEKLYTESSAYRGIWQFAWDAALARLPEDEIALVVNPPTIRSEGHLHVHIVRRNAVALPTAWVTPLSNLDDVWRQAERFALAKGVKDKNFGILVYRSTAGFTMLVEPGTPDNFQNPEKKYTQYED